jgi:hypothetical protein
LAKQKHEGSERGPENISVYKIFVKLKAEKKGKLIPDRTHIPFSGKVTMLIEEEFLVFKTPYSGGKSSNSLMTKLDKQKNSKQL